MPRNSQSLSFSYTCMAATVGCWFGNATVTEAVEFIILFYFFKHFSAPGVMLFSFRSPEENNASPVQYSSCFYLFLARFF